MKNLYRKIIIEIDEGNRLRHIEMSNEELLEQIKLNEKLKQENEKLIEELDLKNDFIQDLLISISYSRDNELHNKCYKKGKIYQEKLNILKGSDKDDK